MLEGGLHLDLEPWSYHIFTPGGYSMKAITVEPKKSATARYEEFPEPDLREGLNPPLRQWPSGSAEPMLRLSKGSTVGRHREPGRLILGHGSLGRGAAAIHPGPNSSLSNRATWWLGLSAARGILSPARTARWASGICAPTGGPPNVASRKSTDFTSERWLHRT